MKKQYIVVRKDLKMGKGKMGGQIAHSSIGASRLLPSYIVDDWFLKDNQTKIVLKVEDLEEMEKIYDICISAGLKPYIVENVGNHQVKDGKKTCMGVGPIDEKDVPDIFKKLKLM